MKEIIIKYPKQERSRRKFQAILDACPRVLEHLGYRKTTTAEIALEADVGIGTFYDYFSCKEAVFIAYVDEKLRVALERDCRLVQDNAASASEMLRELIKVGVDFAYENREIIKLVFTQFPTEIHLVDLKQSKEHLIKISSLFASRHDVKILPKAPGLSIYTLSAIVLGFQFRIVVMPEDSYPRNLIVNELVEVFSNYLNIDSE